MNGSQVRLMPLLSPSYSDNVPAQITFRPYDRTAAPHRIAIVAGSARRLCCRHDAHLATVVQMRQWRSQPSNECRKFGYRQRCQGSVEKYDRRPACAQRRAINAINLVILESAAQATRNTTAPQPLHLKRGNRAGARASTKSFRWAAVRVAVCSSLSSVPS